jgi:hypothetical protein
VLQGTELEDESAKQDETAENEDPGKCLSAVIAFSHEE